MLPPTQPALVVVIFLLRQALQADVFPRALAGTTLLVQGTVAVRGAGGLLFAIALRQKKRPGGPARLRNKATVTLNPPVVATSAAV